METQAFWISLLGGGLFAGLLVFIIQLLKDMILYHWHSKKIISFLDKGNNKFPKGRRTTRFIAKHCNLTPERVDYIGYTSSKLEIIFEVESDNYYWQIT